MSAMLKKSPDTKRTTIQDVASAAGVSPSTVSHVLNGTASISDETKKRVHAAIADLQYYPNVTARSLRKKRTKIIGLVMQDMTSLFYSIAYERLLLRAQREGYLLMIMCGCWDPDLNSKNISSLIEHQAEAIISIGSAVVDDADLHRAADRGIQIVLCDQYSPDFASVEFNNYTTMRRLVHCFVSEGYQRICYVNSGNLLHQDSSYQRQKGYQQGMRDEGLDPDQYMLPLSHQDSKFFRWGIRFSCFTDYLGSLPREQWPEIVLCEHDAIAQASVQSCIEAGIRIPEQMQFFGFDDTSYATLSRPQLSTVRQNPEQLADETFNMLFAMLKSEPHPRHIQLEQEIILRESSFILKDHLEREKLPYSHAEDSVCGALPM